MDKDLCSKCKGRGLCGKPCPILNRFPLLGKIKTHFSGSSPPEIFVGRNDYPNLNTGILAPQEQGNTEDFSSPEKWFANNFSIANILRLRGKLVYARFKSQIKDVRTGNNRFLKVMQEISMADKKVDTEIILKKAPSQELNTDRISSVIGNPAPLLKARLEENPHIPKKIDYLTNDTDSKAQTALQELYHSQIPVSNIIKVLSAGLLGKKQSRKLVPTRWAITATDDTLSKLLLEKIRFYPEISQILLFHVYYVGNHYEFLLLPDKFSFEVMEAYMPESLWNQVSHTSLSIDYESFNGRKEYASQVTGAYYTARLALAEYLEKIKKQAACLVMREERKEYYAPLGVGILREAARAAFSQTPEIFPTIEEALTKSQTRLQLPISTFTSKSWLLKNYGKQTRLKKWI